MKFRPHTSKHTQTNSNSQTNFVIYVYASHSTTFLFKTAYALHSTRFLKKNWFHQTKCWIPPASEVQNSIKQVKFLCSIRQNIKSHQTSKMLNCIRQENFVFHQTSNIQTISNYALHLTRQTKWLLTCLTCHLTKKMYSSVSHSIRQRKHIFLSQIPSDNRTAFLTWCAHELLCQI